MKINRTHHATKPNSERDPSALAARMLRYWVQEIYDPVSKIWRLPHPRFDHSYTTPLPLSPVVRDKRNEERPAILTLGFSCEPLDAPNSIVDTDCLVPRSVFGQLQACRRDTLGSDVGMDVYVY